MQRPRFPSVTEQVAGLLRESVRKGSWHGPLPGRDRLAKELGVCGKTVEGALRLLEKEGLLVSQGPGRRRRIHLPQGAPAAHPLRVAILRYDPTDLTNSLFELQHFLGQAGHSAFCTNKCLLELRMDVDRIARLVATTPADAWVVMAGSHSVLEWFTAREIPVLALFGRWRKLSIAAVGPDKPPAYAAATQRLIKLGHRRIVLLAREERRRPEPGASERAFLDALAAHDIPPGPYHLPDWDETTAGLHLRLASLFDLTPPTALILDGAAIYFAVQQFLMNRGLRVPRDVSLVCTDASEDFTWCNPSVAHIRWDGGPVVRRIVGWAKNVSRGKEDLRQTLTPAEFVPGGTIGAAKG